MIIITDYFLVYVYQIHKKDKTLFVNIHILLINDKKTKYIIIGTENQLEKNKKIKTLQL